MIKSVNMGDIDKITSRENRRLVRVRKVRDGEVRDEIFIEGKRLASEAIASGLELIDCFIEDGFKDEFLLRDIGSRVPVFEVPGKIFATISDTKNSQGIILIAKRPNILKDLDQVNFLNKDSELQLVALLKEIGNPSNLGAVVRTAEAAGVAGVLLSPGSADPFSPKALRGSMGSAFRLPIIENIDLEDAVEWARNKGVQVVATNPDCGRDHSSTNWTLPTLVLFGSEAHGLTEAEIGHAGESVRIPLASGVESLNIAVSAGIIFFEARRQNSQHS